MKSFVYFIAVGLAFTVLQVTTVSADTAAGLVTGGQPPADCGGVPCPTGDDAHTGGAVDCANLKNPDGSAADPDAVAACHVQQSSHADGAHAGMAPGTHEGAHAGMAPGTAPADCGGVPCPTGDAEGMHHHEGMEPPSCAGGEAPMCAGVACPTPEQMAAGDQSGMMAPGTEPMCNDGPAMCGDAPCGPPPA